MTIFRDSSLCKGDDDLKSPNNSYIDDIIAMSPDKSSHRNNHDGVTQYSLYSGITK